MQHGLHNLPHSSKPVDVLELMLGCSRLDGQLPSGLSAWPVLLTRAGTSSRVAGVARRVGSMGVSMGKVPRCHGGPVARWSWWERVCDAFIIIIIIIIINISTVIIIVIVIIIISIVIQNQYFGWWFFAGSKRNPSILTC